MICRRCGADARDADGCPGCGLDLTAFIAEAERRRALADGLPVDRRQPHRRRRSPSLGSLRRAGRVGVVLVTLLLLATGLVAGMLARNAWLIASLQASAHAIVDARHYRHIDEDAMRAAIGRWAQGGDATSRPDWVEVRIRGDGSWRRRHDPEAALAQLAGAGAGVSGEMAFRARVEVQTLGLRRRAVIEASGAFEATPVGYSETASDAPFGLLQADDPGPGEGPRRPHKADEPEVRALLDATRALKGLEASVTPARRTAAREAATALRGWDVERHAAAVLRFGPEAPARVAALAGLLLGLHAATAPDASAATRAAYLGARRVALVPIADMLARAGVLVPFADAPTTVDPPRSPPDNPAP